MGDDFILDQLETDFADIDTAGPVPPTPPAEPETTLPDPPPSPAEPISEAPTPVDEVLAEHREDVESTRRQSMDAPAEDLIHSTGVAETQSTTFSMRGAPLLERLPRRLELQRGGELRVTALTDMFGKDALVLGHLLFRIPPIAIRIKKGNITYRWKPLRTKESIAVKSGNGEAYIEIDLAFVGLHQLQESLAPLISLWKKVPFCFIENSHIRRMMAPNTPEDSMAVCLETLIMDAVAGRPNQVTATLLLRWFNYKPFSENFWFRREWRPAGGTLPAGGSVAAAESPSTTAAEPGTPAASPNPAVEETGTTIVDISAISSPETLRMAQPPEVRINPVAQSTNPGDPFVAPTYPVVYPFNSQPFIQRVTEGTDRPQRINGWSDGLLMQWRTFARFNVPARWGSDRPIERRNPVTPSRDRGAETVAQPVEGDRDIILLVGDSITIGYTGASNPTDISPARVYTGGRSGMSSLPIEEGFTYYVLAKQGARTSQMRSALTEALATDAMKVEGGEDGSRVAGVVIMGGLNDSSRTFDNISAMADSATGAGAIAVVLPPTPFKESTLSAARELALLTDCERIMALGTAGGGDRVVAINSHVPLSEDTTTFAGRMHETYRVGSPPSINVHPGPSVPPASRELRQAGYRALSRYIARNLPWSSLRGAAAPNVWSVVSVEDGDTLTVSQGSLEKVLRLRFIDTLETYNEFLLPEYDSVFTEGQDTGRPPEMQFGQRATEFLRARLAGASVTCEFFGVGEYLRELSVIHHNGENINELMVREGWAFAALDSSDEEASRPYLRAREIANGGVDSSPPGSKRGVYAAQAEVVTLSGPILEAPEREQAAVRNIMLPASWREQYAPPAPPDPDD